MPVKADAYGQKYIYNLPTLNDPNAARAHNADGTDANDPFGSVTNQYVDGEPWKRKQSGQPPLHSREGLLWRPPQSNSRQPRRSRLVLFR
jgi:hypothetical protein